MTERQAELVSNLRGQAKACAMVGSPLYERLLEDAADDVEGGGILARLLEPIETGPLFYGVPLKLLGAVHRLVLEGEAPELAALYPSAGGTINLDRSWPAFEAAIAANEDRLVSLIERPVQTNEVGRCAGLLGGFLEVARRTGLPLRVLEIGASAGLNLQWDRYLYETNGTRWGNPNSQVRCELSPEHLPLLDVDAVVGARRGCDAAPLDPANEQDRVTLLSYVWPDQTWRFEQLRAALDQARKSPVLVEQADAGDWLDAALAEDIPGTATIVFHSLVLFWMDEQTRERVTRTITDAGERATRHRPFAWLSMEAGGEQADVHLTIWPGGERKLVARSGYHGRPVSWLG